MATGYFSLVLHAHLPFVRHPEDPTVMEESWLYEAITGTYLPLVQMFEACELYAFMIFNVVFDLDNRGHRVLRHRAE